MDIAASHPASAPSWSNSLSLGGFASHDHSQHGEDGSCPFCNSSRQQYSGTGQNLSEQASGAAGVAAGLAGAVQAPSPLAPRDVVNLSHRTDQDGQRLKGDQGQSVALGLDIGYGPDAKPVAGGAFEEQHHRDSFTRKEGRSDAVPDQDDDPKAAQTVDRDDGDKQNAILAVPDESELSSEDRQVLEQLRQRDAEVRAHEQAHVAAGGQYVTAGASYTYETGPDGRQYAVAGEVSIDTSPVPGNPEQTEQKAQTIRRAALAPASPSPQDVKVATSAAQMEAEARMERIQNEQEEQQTDGDEHQPAGRAQDQAASDYPGFFSRTPDLTVPTQSFPFDPAPSNHAAYIQAYRKQLALAGTVNLA
ncbi:putative metalloprotease CJM1_0395 family protein [Desulfonatronum thiodismutans]|uniref:putative metalloprotease CJM1_0395 family protein n=1 Tax=Desulfonatronum thiodismutans TaxID=159290 RepID=UPI00068DF588|nr:putative metalloprotease CJM1_0395 family protein [Desulfonatronum thiodismutans]